MSMTSTGFLCTICKTSLWCYSWSNNKLTLTHFFPRLRAPSGLQKLCRASRAILPPSAWLHTVSSSLAPHPERVSTISHIGILCKNLCGPHHIIHTLCKLYIFATQSPRAMIDVCGSGPWWNVPHAERAAPPRGGAFFPIALKIWHEVELVSCSILFQISCIFFHIDDPHFAMRLHE